MSMCLSELSLCLSVSVLSRILTRSRVRRTCLPLTAVGAGGISPNASSSCTRCHSECRRCGWENRLYRYWDWGRIYGEDNWLIM